MYYEIQVFENDKLIFADTSDTLDNQFSLVKTLTFTLPYKGKLTILTTVRK